MDSWDLSQMSSISENFICGPSTVAIGRQTKTLGNRSTDVDDIGSSLFFKTMIYPSTGRRRKHELYFFFTEYNCARPYSW